MPRFTMSEIRRQSHNKRVDQRAAVRMLIMIILLSAVILYFAYKFAPLVK